MSKVVRKRKPAEPPATVLAALLEKYFEDLRVRNYSEYTIRSEPGADRALSRLVRGARHHRAGGGDADGAGKLSAACVSLPARRTASR